MDAVPVFLGMAVVTYFTRYAMIASLRGEMPAVLRRWLRYVPPAILAALITPAALAPAGHVQLGLPAAAVLAGTLVAWRTRNVLATIVGGMIVYMALRALGL